MKMSTVKEFEKPKKAKKRKHEQVLSVSKEGKDDSPEKKGRKGDSRAATQGPSRNWTPAERQQLCEAMREACGTSVEDSTVRSCAFMQWPEAKINGHPAGECKRQWADIVKKATRYMSRDVMLHAATQVAEQWEHVQELEDVKKPTTPYLLFCRNVRAAMTEELPDLSPAQLTVKFGERWKSLPAEQKAIYEAQFQEEKEAYNKYTGVFDMKRLHPFDLFRQAKEEHERKRNKGMPVLMIYTKLRHKYNNLPDKKKLKYIQEALEQDKQYQEAYAEFTSNQPNPPKLKPLLSKDELRILNQSKGLPDRPPRSSYILYLTEHQDMQLTPGQHQLNWGKLSSLVKAEYQERSKKLSQEFQQSLEAYASELGPEERKAVLSENSVLAYASYETLDLLGKLHSVKLEEAEDKRKRKLKRKGPTEPQLIQYYMDREEEKFRRKVAPLELSAGQRSAIRSQAKLAFKQMTPEQKQELQVKFQPRFEILFAGPQPPPQALTLFHEALKAEDPTVVRTTALAKYRELSVLEKHKFTEQHAQLTKQYEQDLKEYLENLDEEDKAKVKLLDDQSDQDISTPIISPKKRNRRSKIQDGGTGSEQDALRPVKLELNSEEEEEGEEGQGGLDSSLLKSGDHSKSGPSNRISTLATGGKDTNTIQTGGTLKSQRDVTKSKGKTAPSDTKTGKSVTLSEEWMSSDSSDSSEDAMSDIIIHNMSKTRGKQVGSTKQQPVLSLKSPAKTGAMPQKAGSPSNTISRKAGAQSDTDSDSSTLSDIIEPSQAPSSGGLIGSAQSKRASQQSSASQRSTTPVRSTTPGRSATPLRSTTSINTRVENSSSSDSESSGEESDGDKKQQKKVKLSPKKLGSVQNKSHASQPNTIQDSLADSSSESETEIKSPKKPVSVLSSSKRPSKATATPHDESSSSSENSSESESEADTKSVTIVKSTKKAENVKSLQQNSATSKPASSNVSKTKGDECSSSSGSDSESETKVISIGSLGNTSAKPTNKSNASSATPSKSNKTSTKPVDKSSKAQTSESSSTSEESSDDEIVAAKSQSHKLGVLSTQKSITKSATKSKQPTKGKVVKSKEVVHSNVSSCSDSSDSESDSTSIKAGALATDSQRRLGYELNTSTLEQNAQLSTSEMEVETVSFTSLKPKPSQETTNKISTRQDHPKNMNSSFNTKSTLSTKGNSATQGTTMSGSTKMKSVNIGSGDSSDSSDSEIEQSQSILTPKSASKPSGKPAPAHTDAPPSIFAKALANIRTADEKRKQIAATLKQENRSGNESSGSHSDGSSDSEREGPGPGWDQKRYPRMSDVMKTTLETLQWNQSLSPLRHQLNTSQKGRVKSEEKSSSSSNKSESETEKAGNSSSESESVTKHKQDGGQSRGIATKTVARKVDQSRQSRAETAENGTDSDGSVAELPRVKAFALPLGDESTGTDSPSKKKKRNRNKRKGGGEAEITLSSPSPKKKQRRHSRHDSEDEAPDVLPQPQTPPSSKKKKNKKKKN